jgi:hypothetical protein
MPRWGCHFLVTFPLAFVLAGSLLAQSKEPVAGRGLTIVAAILILAQVASVAPFYPHFIPYVNEFVADRSRAYKLFADSNLAWGGDDYYLKQYQVSHPEALFEPSAPSSGTIIVEVNNLVGLLDPEKFRWLREGFEPRAIIAGGSYLIYQVAAEELAAIPNATPESQTGRSAEQRKP